MIQLISSINPSIKHKIHKFSYQGTFLGESSISATIETSQPIVFAIGDYVEYRGERFVLNYIPAKQKQARSGTHGSAFVYENIKFNSLADELTRVEFLDVVLADNKIHYSSLSDFSFYAISVKDLASRIQANLDRVFFGDDKWTVNVSPDCVTSDMNIDVTKQNCWAALTLAHSEFGVNFIIRNRTITIGTAGLAVGKLFGYGKGKGLYDIQQTTNADALVITRLRAFGSSRNLPHRYYNKLKKANSTPYINESVYIPNLMLPAFPYQNADPSKIYIDSDSKSDYGLREGSVYFDGTDSTDEIYPSLEGMTKKLLNDAGITVSLKSGDNGNIDECLSVVNPTDNGEIPTDGKIPAEFTIYLKDLGFDLSAKDKDGQYVYSTTDTMQISMKSGMCVGRTFDVVDKGITKVTDGGYTQYKIVCKRFTDESIAGGTAFPNRNYNISAGDKFVILGIDMPDVYVKTAAQRLLIAAKDYLSQHDETKYTYLPKIDEIFMANNPEVGEKLKEGDILNFTDTDLEIDASVIIQTLKISVGDKVIPTYEVTLSNEIVAGTLDKMQSAINQLASSHTGITLEQVKSVIQSYGTRFFLSRLANDTAEGNIEFVQDVSVGKDLTVHQNVMAKGRVISDKFSNSSFTSGQFGSGFKIWKDANNGQSYAEFDNLLVRRETIFNILSIAEIKAVGGQILVSCASMSCSNIIEFSDGYKCYFDNDGGNIINRFAEEDQAICRKFDGQNMKNYWRRVLDVDADYIFLSKEDCDGSGVPEVGDEIIQFGNRTDATRQSAILISAYGFDAPSIKQYSGINSYDLTGKEVTVISPSGNKFSGTFSVVSGTNKNRVPADRGNWVIATPYYYYDRVSYKGALWLCVIPEGQSTMVAPTEANVFWQKQVAEGQKGDKGETGLQGVAGAKGEDGKTTYTWIRYADTITGGGISNLPTNKLYIGLAYNKTTATESNLPTDYKWSLIKGDKGDTGVEGTKGKDGQTTYTWIKYADVADGTGLYDLPKATTKYIGIAVNKTTAAESTNKADYTWSLFKGDKGETGLQGVAGAKGEDGKTTYTWIRYADTITGGGISNLPTNKLYIGLAYNKTTATESNLPTDYKWSLIKGDKGDTGDTGVEGTKGKDGQTTYTWIKYADVADGTGLYDLPKATTKYIGIAVNKTVAAESVNKADYTWSLFKGDKGETGLQGVAGAKGEDGKTTYTWIRYADTITGGGISNLPTNKLYIGLAYNKITATESNLPADYKWSLIKGDKGDTGVEGTKGKDGQTTYTWIKYADVADGTGLYDLPKATTKYIGIAVNKTMAAESVNKADYTWSLFKGADGADGTNGTNGKDGRDGVNGSQGIAGTSSYFHVRYSANANGNPMTTAPAKYIGTAVTTSNTAPTGYTSYSWYEWKGAQGTDGKQGIAGTSGANGQTSYLHIKYSNDGGKTLTANAGEDVGDWIGQYVDFTAADSNDVKKYLWSKIKGQAGDLIYVKGTNWNKNTLARVEVNGVTVSSPTIRGLTLTVLKRTDLSLVFKQSYDIYGTDANIATTLADKIKSYDSNHFIILNSYDAIKFNTNLINAMVSVGATGQFLNGRYSYALIGYKGLAKGAALEVTVFDTNEPYYAEIATNVINGQFVGTGTNVETIQSVVNASFQILDDKIASKVSQTDFSSLSGRVSTAESKIVQQAGQITSTVQKVEGKNAVYKSYTAAVTDRPPVPYAKNDIWITYEGVMKQSKVNRITGVFVEADWADTTKYTDDTAVNNLQIGGRNYALNTSNEWLPNITLSNIINNCIFSHRVVNVGWKAGDSICVSFEYKYEKITKSSTTNYLTLQGSGNVTQWVNGFTSHSFLNKIDFTKGSGIALISYTFNLSAGQVSNAYFDINFRHDYMTGLVSIRNLKVEKGNKVTDWSPAQEDIETSISNAANKRIRYIRDWLNGNTANTGNHWVQIAAYNIAGTNIALNKNVSGASVDKRVTNGNTDTTTYVNTAAGLQQLTVDLGAIHDIHKIKVWHYYADGRTYNATKTECSVDNVNWFTVFDSAVSGKYKETSAGNVILVTDNANNAENQNRNRTYYSDTTPAVPEGGHRTGDLWYKISLSAGCYTTNRWNGATWVVINEYVSKAQQIITDNSITNLVTKTGIGSLGTGETLMSKINQTANNITLEVGKIQIGGTNLFLNSSFTNGFASWGQNGGTRVIETDLVHGKVVKFTATAVNQGIYQNPSTRRTSGKTYVISGYIKAATSTRVKVAHEGGGGSIEVAVTTAWQRFETLGVWTSGGSVCFYSTAASTFYLAKLQYEEGNKSSAWSPAPEDVPFMVGSSLSLDGNKITLTGGQIELNGLTITKALEASTATIGGFKVADGKFESVSQTSGKPNLFLDGKNGTAYLRGGLITPFQGGYYRLGSGGGVEMSTYGLQDNNNVVITGYGGGWKTAFTVPFTSQYNGFRATILNDNFEGKTSLGTIDASAPTGKYFFEKGERKSYLTVRMNEGVEMIGYGEGNIFHGWIILNRFDTNIHNQNGAAVTVHNMGMVKSNRIYKQTRHDPISSMTRLSEGKYRLYFKEPYSSVDNYMVMITCESSAGGRFGSITAKGTSYFDIYTGDDSSPNDSDFNFVIIATLGWNAI